MLEVGRIVKPHGLRGEVVVDLVSDRLERLEPGSVLTTDIGELTVRASRPYQQRFIVSFEEVGDRSRADEVRGLALRATPIEDPDALWVHDLIGVTAIRADGTVCGRVVAVQANPADDLVVLDTGALVPARFVVGWDDERRIVIDPPEGLLDL